MDYTTFLFLTSLCLASSPWVASGLQWDWGLRLGLCGVPPLSSRGWILTQSVNGTAHGPSLVLYTPAVSFTDCTGIVGGLRIEESKPDMKVNGHGNTCPLYTLVLYSPAVCSWIGLRFWDCIWIAWGFRIVLNWHKVSLLIVGLYKIGLDYTPF